MKSKPPPSEGAGNLPVILRYGKEISGVGRCWSWVVLSVGKVSKKSTGVNR